jgi:hypothetical protein
MTEDIKFTEDLHIDVSGNRYILSCIKDIYKESSLHNAVIKSNVYMTSEIYERVEMNADGMLVLKYTIMIKSHSRYSKMCYF